MSRRPLARLMPPALALLALVIAPGAQAASPSPAAVPAPSASAAGWTSLALGDSNVYAPAEACGSCTGYPHVLAGRITDELGIPVRLIDGSQWNKLTMGTLAAEIDRDSWGEGWEQPHDNGLSPRAAIAAADLITITVAANDLPYAADPDRCGAVYDQACIDKLVPAYRTNLAHVLAEIAEIRAGRPTAILVTTLYNDTIAGPGYDPTWYYAPAWLETSRPGAAAFIDALNAAIVEAAGAAGATVIDMHAVANGPDGTRAVPEGWFSKDFGDLNQAGQDAFAAEMLRVGFAPLAVPNG